MRSIEAAEGPQIETPVAGANGEVHSTGYDHRSESSWNDGEEAGSGGIVMMISRNSILDFDDMPVPLIDGNGSRIIAPNSDLLASAVGDQPTSMGVPMAPSAGNPVPIALPEARVGTRSLRNRYLGAATSAYTMDGTFF